MKRQEVKNLVFKHLESPNDALLKTKLDAVLEAHPEYQELYKLMSQALLPVDEAMLPRLPADPFLPTRVKALSKETEVFPVTKKNNLLNWSLSAFAVTFAMFIGIYLGKGLAVQNETLNETEIVNGYYQVFFQTESGTDWNSILSESVSGEQQ